MASLTDVEVKGAIARAKKSGSDVWLTDEEKARGVGRFRVRAMPTANASFLFRYSDSEGKQRHLLIGTYDPRGKTGLSLKGAREKAGELSRRYQSGERDLHAHLEYENAMKLEAIAKDRRDREEAQRQANAGSLRALFSAYVGHLERLRRPSAQDVRNIIRRNVFEEFPVLADTQASALTRADCNLILSRLLERGAGRTAAKLRAFGRAAFTLALQAEADPTVPASLHGFQLSANPWAAVPAKAFSAFNKARERALNESELRGYMAGLDALPDGITKAALWLGLLLGGQRPTQLVRLRPEDIDLDGFTVTLHDGKGARRQPRAHVLPLPRRATEIASHTLALVQQSFGGAVAFVFTNTGTQPVRTETLSAAVTEISRQMMAEGSTRAPFELRDVRRTCETLLAGMGISRDVRAQLLSHGLGGVQDRHYDRHDYLNAKREALEAWESKLEEIVTGAVSKDKVIGLRRAR